METKLSRSELKLTSNALFGMTTNYISINYSFNNGARSMIL